MPLVDRPEHEFAHHPIGIVIAHRELAPDHLLLLAVFFRRQSGVHHRVRQNIERDCDAFLRHVDPVNGAIERRVGVDVAALILHALRDGIGRAGLGSLKQHVLENVGKTGAKMSAFVDAARAAPRLHTRDRRAPVVLHDNGEAVRQSPLLCGNRRKRDRRRTARGHRVELSGVQHGRKSNNPRAVPFIELSARAGRAEKSPAAAWPPGGTASQTHPEKCRPT